MRIFIYGTLLDPAIMALVLGHDGAALRYTAGLLKGYRRVRAEGAWFPVVLPAEDGVVDGALVDGLEPGDIARLRWYETDAYRLEPCAVRTAEACVFAHVFLPTDRLAGSDDPWTLEQWPAEARERALAETAAHMDGFPIGGFPLSGAPAHVRPAHGAKRVGFSLAA